MLLDKAKRGVKERIIKAYKEIYNRDVVIDTAEALCVEMNFSKNIMKQKRKADGPGAYLNIK